MDKAVQVVGYVTCQHMQVVYLSAFKACLEFATGQLATCECYLLRLHGSTVALMQKGVSFCTNTTGCHATSSHRMSAHTRPLYQACSLFVQKGEAAAISLLASAVSTSAAPLCMTTVYGNATSSHQCVKQPSHSTCFESKLLFGLCRRVKLLLCRCWPWCSAQWSRWMPALLLSMQKPATASCCKPWTSANASQLSCPLLRVWRGAAWLCCWA